MQLYWGIMQDRVYKTNVKGVEELRQRSCTSGSILISTQLTLLSGNGAKDYKFVLPLKEDSSSTHCDILSTLTIKLLFLFMTVALRRCVVDNNSSDWTLWLKFYFQKMHVFIALLQTFDISTTNTDWRMIAATLDLHWCGFGRETAKSSIGCFYGPQCTM